MPIQGNDMNAPVSGADAIQDFAKRLQKDLTAQPEPEEPAPEQEKPKVTAPVTDKVSDEELDARIAELVPANMTHEQFVDYLIKDRAKVPPPPPPPPPLTQRQKSQLEREMEAGRARVAHYAAMDRQRTPAPVEKSEHVTETVYRSGEYQHEKNANKVSTQGF